MPIHSRFQRADVAEHFAGEARAEMVVDAAGISAAIVAPIINEDSSRVHVIRL
jgi:hypothetical protein